MLTSVKSRNKCGTGKLILLINLALKGLRSFIKQVLTIDINYSQYHIPNRILLSWRYGSVGTGTILYVFGGDMARY